MWYSHLNILPRFWTVVPSVRCYCLNTLVFPALKKFTTIWLPNHISLALPATTSSFSGKQELLWAQLTGRSTGLYTTEGNSSNSLLLCFAQSEPVNEFWQVTRYYSPATFSGLYLWKTSGTWPREKTSSRSRHKLALMVSWRETFMPSTGGCEPEIGEKAKRGRRKETEN